MLKSKEILKYSKIYKDFLTLSRSHPTLQQDNIDEKLIQSFWQQAYFAQTLTSVTGNKIEILDLGYLNDQSGPDFKQAVIKINGKLHTGDIEIDLKAQNWYTHQHHKSTEFNNVILHLVWEDIQEQPQHQIPTVVLKKFLLKSNYNLKETSSQNLSPSFTLNTQSTEQIYRILTVAGIVRMEQKIKKIQRLQQFYSIEEVFYMKFFEALGYSHNTKQFNCLCQRLRFNKIQELQNNIEKSAVLWGMASLLPNYDEKNIHPELEEYSQKRWSIWGHLRDRYYPPIVWDRKPQRPTNSAFRRLAAGIKFMEGINYDIKVFLQNAITLLTDKKEFFKYLENSLTLNSSLEKFYSFTHKTTKNLQLIGRSRRDDIIINIFIPIIYYLVQENNVQKNLLLNYYQTYRALGENKKIKLSLERFVGENISKKLSLKAIQQQGLIQMFDDFNWNAKNKKNIIAFWKAFGIDCFISNE